MGQIDTFEVEHEFENPCLRYFMISLWVILGGIPLAISYFIAGLIVDQRIILNQAIFLD